MRRLIIAATLAAAVPGAALAQNADLRPQHGEISLNSGFTPDPYGVTVTAGGPIDADALGDECTGHVSNAPSVQLTYRAGSFPLAFRTRSDIDTVLAVRAPDGRWVCDDDSWMDGDEEVRFDDPPSGAYDVWVGTYSSGSTGSASLLITETPGPRDSFSLGSTPAPPTVDIRVCNRSGRNATVATSYVEVGSERFVNRGWFPVDDGACIELASTRNANFYMYADALDDSGRTWSGNHALCVEYPGPYTFYSAGETECAAGRDLRNFVPLHAEDFGTYTWTLNP